jgi:hypothetical protein
VPLTFANFFVLHPPRLLTGCPVLLPPAPRMDWMCTTPPAVASRPVTNGPASRAVAFSRAASAPSLPMSTQRPPQSSTP